MDVALVQVKPWEEDADFLKFNPAGEPPVYVDEFGQYFSDSQAICEYLIEEYKEVGTSLMPNTPKACAEVRRIIGWLDRKFYLEVTSTLLWEKYAKRYHGHGGPDSAIIRGAMFYLGEHLNYFEWLSSRRDWISGESISIADLDLGSHLSVVDFFGSLDWDKYPSLKEWYAKIKSRPSFRSLLIDRLTGIKPPPHYTNLDF